MGSAVDYRVLRWNAGAPSRDDFLEGELPWEYAAGASQTDHMAGRRGMTGAIPLRLWPAWLRPGVGRDRVPPSRAIRSRPERAGRGSRRPEAAPLAGNLAAARQPDGSP